jgi:diguanylate cyclase (GGDEF)-like protein
MAANPDVLRAIRRGDRQELAKIFEPALQMFPIDFFTILDGRGRALVRVHDLDNYGDSLLSQQNVRDALNGRVSSYIEQGATIKLSARAGAPVRDARGAIVGVVSAGVRLDSLNVANKLKTLLHSDTAFFLGNSILATTLDADSLSHTAFVFGSKEAQQNLAAGREYFGEASIQGGKYKTYYKPLLTFDNRHFATVFLCINISPTASQFHILLWKGALLVFVGFTLSNFLMFHTFLSIRKRIIALTKKEDRVSHGELEVDFLLKGSDEISSLGKSMQNAENIVNKLLKEISHMISEHRKGNVSYRLILEEFEGKFATLAENILELTNLSIKDRLTGLPNRRSFYSRLIHVRERAISETASTSILLVDIDSFKRLGFEQANAAMKAVADLCTKSLMHDIDIVTRWAGDLFIVLLPNTKIEPAQQVAERIRARVENADIVAPGVKSTKITVSIGGYTYVPTEADSADDLIFKGHEALNSAKDGGRNTVRFLERQ